MLKWAEQPRKFQYRRLAAYYYVMLCFTTGVRPGTAMDSLRWRDIEAVQTNNDFTANLIRGFRIEKPEGNDAMGEVRLAINVPTSKVSHYYSIGLNDAFWKWQEYKTKWLLIAQDLAEIQLRRSKREQVNVNMTFNENEPLFKLPNSYHLTGTQVSKYFKEYLDYAGLTFAEGTDDRRTLYSTRHSFITDMRSQGVPDAIIAEFTGTSPEMFKKHYGHPKVRTEGHKFGNYSKERLK